MDFHAKTTPTLPATIALEGLVIPAEHKTLFENNKDVLLKNWRRLKPPKGQIRQWKNTKTGEIETFEEIIETNEDEELKDLWKLMTPFDAILTEDIGGRSDFERIKGTNKLDYNRPLQRSQHTHFPKGMIRSTIEALQVEQARKDEATRKQQERERMEAEERLKKEQQFQQI